MTDQHLAEKRSLRSLKRRRIIAGRMQVFGSPYIPDVKMKRARAVMDFRGYKEAMRDIVPPDWKLYGKKTFGIPPIDLDLNADPKNTLWQRFLAWFRHWKSESGGDLLG